MTDDFVLAMQDRLRALAEEQRKRHGRHSPNITKRQLLELTAKQEQQRIELLAERADEDGEAEAAKDLSRAGRGDSGNRCWNVALSRGAARVAAPAEFLG